MQEETAFIFDIEKFAVHDGPGIRTTVFIKGCPLRCLWCHNPESQSFEPEIFFSSEKCIGCGFCVKICPQHCHTIQKKEHIFDRANCTKCGKCTEKCYSGALELAGKKMTVQKVMEEVLKDRLFYENSGGGITLSGGEPLANFCFTEALLREAKKAGLHTAVETSGYAPWEKIAALLPVVDLWLWDVKALPETHRKLTGVSSDLILDNLQKLNAAGGKIILRCPLIPDVNDEDQELLRIAKLASSLNHVQEINLEPYHPLGEGKNLRLGKENLLHADFADPSRKAHWLEILKKHTQVPVY